MNRVTIAMAAALVAVPTLAQAPSTRLARTRSTISATCLLMPAEQITLSSNRDGLISKINVKPGETVQTDQILIEIDKRQSLAEFRVAEKRYAQAVREAENKGKALLAKTAIERADTELDLLEKVGLVPFLEKFRVENDRERGRSELVVAEEENAVNQEQVLVRKAELDLARIDTDQRVLRSRFNGAVVRQLKFEGEYVERGTPIMKMVQLDELLLQGLINTSDIPPHLLVGQDAVFTIQLRGEDLIEVRDLQIERVSPETDLDGNYSFWIRIPNEQRSRNGKPPQWLMRPGMRGHLDIRLPSVRSTAKSI